MCQNAYCAYRAPILKHSIRYLKLFFTGGCMIECTAGVAQIHSMQNMSHKIHAQWAKIQIFQIIFVK